MATNQPFDFFVQLHLTDRCNLRCRHCYQTEWNGDEMSFVDIQSLIREIAETLALWKELYSVYYSPSFNVTGGEPLMRDDLLDILSEIGFRGFDIYLLTNGILLSLKKANALSYLGIKGVQVSIEGPEKIHDAIRGKGSLSKSLNGIRRLLDAGMKVTMNTTLSSVNADSFTDIVDMASRLGVQKVGFSRLVPYGRGEEMLQNTLTSDEVKDLYKKIFSLNTGDIEIVTGDPVASQMYADSSEDRGNIPLGGCAAGVSGITILPDGTLIPCRRMYIPLGNIRRDSLREIWAASPVLEAIRDRNRYRGRCGTCRQWANCRGCRAIAYAFSRAKGVNDFLAEDPQCFIET